MKFYAGIGSRSTPRNILEIMRILGRRLMLDGYTLRSGGADGADSAFEEATEGHMKIFIPWNGFNNRRVNGDTITAVIPPAAFTLAAQVHPAWHRCSAGARKLHARNCMQVLGEDLDSPSDFVLCWTPRSNGQAIGGTGQAIRLAELRGIPVYDLGFPNIQETFESEWLGGAL